MEDSAIDLNFKGYRAPRIHPYPATMPLPLAQWLIENWTEPGDLVLDPFCGSGTTLLAARSLARHGIGSDINPIARLITEVTLDVLHSKFDIALYSNSIMEIGQSKFAQVFPNEQYHKTISKWFDEGKIEELAHIAGALKQIQAPATIKRFLMLAFSRTVRLVSRTRQNELKLWSRANDNPKEYALQVFATEARQLLASLIQIRSEITVNEEMPWKLLDKEASQLNLKNQSPKMILTSPPYGDSATTVAYGNFTMLNSIWLSAIDSSFISTDPAIQDRLAPGGNRYIDRNHNIKDISATPVLDETRVNIARKSPKRANDLVLFWTHMHSIFTNLLNDNRILDHIAIVIGPRTMAGVPVDNGEIISEMIESMKFARVFDQTRSISGKRLPTITKQGDNGVNRTIVDERVIVFKASEIDKNA